MLCLQQIDCFWYIHDAAAYKRRWRWWIDRNNKIRHMLITIHMNCKTISWWMVLVWFMYNKTDSNVTITDMDNVPADVYFSHCNRESTLVYDLSCTNCYHMLNGFLSSMWAIKHSSLPYKFMYKFLIWMATYPMETLKLMQIQMLSRLITSKTHKKLLNSWMERPQRLSWFAPPNRTTASQYTHRH